jgi:hypothetical protein
MGIPISYSEKVYKNIKYEFFHRLIHSIEHYRHIDAGDDNMGTEAVLELLITGIVSIEKACETVDGFILLES